MISDPRPFSCVGELEPVGALGSALGPGRDRDCLRLRTTGGRESVEQTPPVWGNAPGWTGHRLIRRMVMRRRQRGSLPELVGPVVPEPLLARFEAADDRMLGCHCMGGGMPTRRVVAAADVPALGATTQVQPPPACLQALDTPCPTRLHSRSDERCGHCSRWYATSGFPACRWLHIAGRGHRRRSVECRSQESRWNRPSPSARI